RRVEPSILAGAPAHERPMLLAIRPDAGANEERVSRTDFHPGLFLPRLNVLDVNRRSRLEVLETLQARNVDKDAAGENAVLDVDQRVARVPVVLLDLLGVRSVPVEEYALVVDVRQGVEMRVRPPVHRYADVIG